MPIKTKNYHVRDGYYDLDTIYKTWTEVNKQDGLSTSTLVLFSIFGVPWRHEVEKILVMLRMS